MIFEILWYPIFTPAVSYFYPKWQGENGTSLKVIFLQEKFIDQSLPETQANNQRWEL